MAITLYLAMTGPELRRSTSVPRHVAWLSCLFSPYGTALSNIPKQLPDSSLLILSDRTPICGHDTAEIFDQVGNTVTNLGCQGVLLDFQRPGCAETAAIAAELVKLGCPVAVSQAYAAGLDCPIFLPPAPLNLTLQDYLTPYRDREIWLELALDKARITVTAEGSVCSPAISFDRSLPHHCPELCCHYRTEPSHDAVEFTLQRTKDDLKELIKLAEQLGVSQAVGLWQELK